MDKCVSKAREKIKKKCNENNEYIISKLEAYILICESAKEIVQLCVYEKLEEKIKNGNATKEDLMGVCEDVFGKNSPVSSIVRNMNINEVFTKEEMEEYQDIINEFKSKDIKKKI
jgi:hypothetical protein